MSATPLALAIVLATFGGPASAGGIRGSADLPPEPATPTTTTTTTTTTPTPTTPAATVQPEPAPAEPTRILGAVVSIDGVDADATREALALRLPELPIYDRRQGAPSSEIAGLYAYLEIRRRDPETIALRVILSDGRAFRREVPAQDADAPRVIAGTLASLLPAIEEATIIADEEDVELPEALLPEDPPPGTAEEPEQEQEQEQEPTPTPTPKPDEDSEPRQPAEDPPPKIDVGLTLGTGGLFGAAPPISGWRGASGHLGVELRLPRSILAGVELRIAGGRTLDVRLLRLRSALTVGYILRRRAFEMPMAALLSLEPWWLRDGLGATNNSDGSPPRPLLGLGLRLSPGVFVTLPKQFKLRVGARLETSLSGEARRGLPRPRITQEPALDSALTLGGLEFSAGVDLTLWLPSARANRRRR